MNLEYEIIKYLKKFNYKPGYVWKPMNYLNGFLVNCIDNNTMLPQSEFFNIMTDYCNKGYFTTENEYRELPTYRLTEEGYQNLILN